MMKIIEGILMSGQMLKQILVELQGLKNEVTEIKHEQQTGNLTEYRTEMISRID